jgi:hypothetical protein
MLLFLLLFVSPGCIDKKREEREREREREKSRTKKEKNERLDEDR